MELQGCSAANTRANMILALNLLEALERLEALKIQAAAFKSPLLAQVLYGEIGRCEESGLELLVRRDRVRRATEGLQAAGWRVFPDLRGVRGASWQDLRRECRLLKEEASVRLYLRWEIAPDPFPAFPGMEQVWERMGSVSFGGREVTVLSPEDVLLVLCMEGSARFWQRPGDLRDVKQWIQRYPSADWDRISRIARAAGVHRMLQVGLRMAGHPAGPADRDPVARSLVNQCRRALSSVGQAAPRSLQRVSFWVRVREGWRDKLFLVLHHLRLLVHPTAEEWLLLPLPDWLFPLYYTLRPLVLLRQGVARLRTGSAGGERLAGFVPTPLKLVEQMLALADVKSSDVVCDLGCGDGRFLVQAAKRFGAHGIGLDIDPVRVLEAREAARRERVEHLIAFKKRDALSADLSGATVVTLFLPEASVQKLQPLLQRGLRPGSRVVSRDSKMRDWLPAKQVDCRQPDARLYLWRVGTD